MNLEIIKRFEFAAAHKYWDSALSYSENFEKYGKDSLGKFGHGHNFIVFLAFTGVIDPKTGMICELSDIKRRVWESVISHFDHRYLNDLEPFLHVQPTPQAIADCLLDKTEQVFEGSGIFPTWCQVIETAMSEAFSYSDKVPVVQHVRPGVSKISVCVHATHCLTSASLSALEHDTLFGKCQFVHGHAFEIDIFVEAFNDSYREQVEQALESWQYRSLNDEVPELQGKLCTCETIIQVLYHKLSGVLDCPITEIVLKETPNNMFRLTV